MDNRISSWKEIATYFKCGVRTVQRWERLEGLPVHRHLHSKLGSVYAYRQELEAWRAARMPRTAEPLQPIESPGEADIGNRIGDPGSQGRRVGVEAAARDSQTQVRVASLHAGWMAKRGALIASGAVLFLVAVVVTRLIHPAPRAEAGRAMLAVLPFLNLSGDPSQDYFSDGLTEEMITELGRVDPARLGVIARTSAMKYQHTEKDVGEIGRELGVSYILRRERPALGRQSSHFRAAHSSE